MGRLFSRFVFRVSGAASDGVEGMRAERAVQGLQELDAAEERVAALRERVSELLFAAVGEETDRNRRNALLRARRDLFNGRPVALDQLPHLPAGAGEAVHALQQGIREHERLDAAWERLYLEEAAELRRRFRVLLDDPWFRKGVLVSSRSLYEAMESHAAGTPPSGRDEKTERGLLRYYTRASMKATPFATFCTVVPGELVAPPADGPGGDAPPRLEGDLHARRSYVRINRALYATLLGHLTARPEVRRHLVVEPNPTLDLEEGRFVFLAVMGRREAFQRVPANEVLRHIASLLQDGGPATLGALAGALARDPRVQAAPEQAVAYLDRLLEIGFLRFRTGIDEQDADWDLPLRALLETMDDDHARRCAALLRTLRERSEAYARATLHERARLVGEIHAEIEAAFGAMGLEGGAGLPFYEDTTADARAVLELTPGWRRAAETLVEWVRLTARLAEPRGEQATMRHFFDTRYRAGAVPLLRFYEDFHREHLKEHLERERELAAGAARREEMEYDVENPFGLELIGALNAARDRLRERILARWREAPGAEEIRLSLAEVEEAVGGVEPQPVACRSVNAFAIPVPPADGSDAALLLQAGRYLPGFGKYFSRFLYLLPEELREAVRVENEGLSRELLAEICGDSHFNGNLHPPLLPWELSYPTGESGAAEKQLRTSEIVVEPDADDPQALALRHAPTGRRVVPVDLGFLNYRARPPLYRLLSRFTPPAAFAPPIPGRLTPEDDAHAIAHRPRITVEGRVVLARRSWAIPGELFPRIGRDESASAFFARAVRWQRESGIPESCYLRILVLPDPPAEKGAPAARPAHDLEKPQFMDFANPLLVGMLGRMAAGLRSFRVLVEERLPGPGGVPRHEGAGYATEMVVQIDFPETPGGGDAA